MCDSGGHKYTTTITTTTTTTTTTTKHTGNSSSNNNKNNNNNTQAAATQAHLPADTDTKVAPKPPPGKHDSHDGTKCDDDGNDCCALELWGESQACKDGYIPRFITPDECHNPFCVLFTLGMGCYGCYPPSTTGTCARLRIF